LGIFKEKQWHLFRLRPGRKVRKKIQKNENNFLMLKISRIEEEKQAVSRAGNGSIA